MAKNGYFRLFMKITKGYTLYFLVYKNLQLKYKHSLLGFVWSFVHPLFYLLIFNFVFSRAFSEIENYSLFVLSGLIFWVYFSGSCNQLSQTFIKNTHLIKSLQVKKILYPISEQLTELVSFLAGFSLFIFLMIYLNLHINLSIIYIIPIIILFSVFTFSVGLILGSLNVFFRDVGILWNTLNPALFYLTPIAYSFDIIPQESSFYFKLNPLYHFLYLIRNVLHQGTAPDFRHSIYCVIISFITVCISIIIYKKTKNGFISNL